MKNAFADLLNIAVKMGKESRVMDRAHNEQ